MSYTPVFQKPYPDGWENLPSEDTPITAEALNGYDGAIENIETYLSNNDIVSVEANPAEASTDSLTKIEIDGTVYGITGGGGSSTFAGLSDVDFDNLQNGQVPVYNSTTNKWENGAGGGGASLPIDISDNVNNVTGILNTANGGTGNSDGYVRTGQSSGSTIGTRATAEGYNVVSSGECAHAEGLSEDSTYKIQATGKGAHAEGYIGSGYVSNTLASGNGAHAEGSSTQATANCAHSEGLGSIASAMCAHAEGSGIASAQASHAEGTGTEAKGINAHAEGQKTIARGANSHAQGRYNIEDLNNAYAHIVGNGTDANNRSNAHTLDWSGNAWFAGDVTDGTNNVLSAKANTTDVNNKHKITNFEVSTSGWTADTTSQSGTTLYKKQVSLSHVYANPSVDIGASTGNVLPTTAEQTAYNLVQYVTVDDTVPCLYLYASDTPTNAFNIDVEGVD